MDYFTKTIQRLVYFIDSKGINFNKLSIEIGVSNSYFSKMVRNNASIGSDILEKILRKFPDLNPSWLLTGSGEMIIDPLKIGENNIEALPIRKDELPPGPCRQCEGKDQIIAALQDTIPIKKYTIQ